MREHPLVNKETVSKLKVAKILINSLFANQLYTNVINIINYIYCIRPDSEGVGFSFHVPNSYFW